jgi:hypothetical protein
VLALSSVKIRLHNRTGDKTCVAHTHVVVGGRRLGHYHIKQPGTQKLSNNFSAGEDSNITIVIVIYNLLISSSHLGLNQPLPRDVFLGCLPTMDLTFVGLTVLILVALAVSVDGGEY